MKKLTSWIFAAAISCAPLSAAYSYKASVAFTGATGSTQTNITLAFRFNDPKIATTPNGGQIQNLCSRNGNSVPCDFVFTNDATCASVTGGYTWGFDGDYSATAGTGSGWVMISSYTTSGATPTVCIGDTSVSTYQGGAAGSEYDSNTVGVWHLANGTTLSGTSYKGSTNCTLVNSPVAAAGKIDGGMQTTAASSQRCETPVTTSGYPPATWSGWVKVTTTSGEKTFFGNAGGGGGGLEIRVDNSTNKISMLRSQAAFVFTSAGAVTTNTFAFIAVTCDGSGNLVLYRDSATPETFSSPQPGFMTRNAIWLGANSFAGENFTGVLDEMRIDSTVRSANWIATVYANQNVPPVVGAFSALGGSSASVPAAVY